MTLYYPRASRPKRLAAAAVDALIGILPFMAVAGAIASPLYALFMDPDTTWAGRFSLEVVICLYGALPVSFFWFCFYSLLRDSFGKGQSWGKKLFGLMVMDLERHLPCDRQSSFNRHYLGFSLTLFAVMLPFLALVLPLVEPLAILRSGQGLRAGDRWARTQVIEYKNRHLYGYMS